MSIGEDPVANGESAGATREGGDSRLASNNGRLTEEDEDGELAELDMDFFPAEAPATGRGGRRADRRLHTFGRVESSRSDRETGEGDEGDNLDGRDRARRRAAGLPILHKFVSSFLSSPFPIHLPVIHPLCPRRINELNDAPEHQPPSPTPSQRASPTSTTAPPPLSACAPPYQQIPASRHGSRASKPPSAGLLASKSARRSRMRWGRWRRGMRRGGVVGVMRMRTRVGRLGEGGGEGVTMK